MARLLCLVALFQCPAHAGEEDFYLTGIIYPIHDVSLSLAMDGPLAKIHVAEGDFVEEGQALLTLDDRLQRLEVDRRKSIYEDKSQLEATEKNLALLKELVATKEGLAESTKTVSKSELKRNVIQLNQAEGEFISLKEIKTREEIEYKISQQVLETYSLSSPIKGQVVDIIKERGEWVKTGDPVIRIIDSSTCYLDINLDASKALRLNQEGQAVKIRVLTGDKPILKTGKIHFIAPVADGGSGLVRIKVHFQNDAPKVIPGVTGQLVLE